MNIAEEWRSRLSECEWELIVHFPVRMDDGEVKVLTGFRVLASQARRRWFKSRHPLQEIKRHRPNLRLFYFSKPRFATRCPAE